MARSEARIQVAIWSDPDFRALSAGAQWTYMFLLSQPDVGHHGVLPLRERRWSTAAGGLTADRIREDLDELTKCRFIVVDENTEELLIRSLIRCDGIYRQPNLLRNVRDNLTVVQSPALRAAIAIEVRRIVDECTDIPTGSQEPLRRILETLGSPTPTGAANPQAPSVRNPSAKGSRKGSPNPTSGDLFQPPLENASEPQNDDANGTHVHDGAEAENSAFPQAPRSEGNPSRNPSPNPSANPSRGAPGVRGKGKVVVEVALSTTHSSSAIADASTDTKPRTRPDIDEICHYLADAIEANGSRRPNVTKRWRDAARLLLDRDGRTVEQVKRAIDWSQSHDFWRSNVLSMPKLREKYDQLRLQAQRPVALVRANGAAPRSTTDERVNAALAVADELDRLALEAG